MSARDGERRGFVDPLAVWHKKLHWQEQALRLELASAQQSCARRQAERDELAQALLALDAQLIALQRGSFDPARHQRLSSWRALQARRLLDSEGALAQAQALRERTVQQLQGALKALRAHEARRERLAGEHRLACEREAARRQDDAWLLRRAWALAQENA